MSNMMAPNFRTRSPFDEFFGAPFDMFAPGFMAAPPRRRSNRPHRPHGRPLPTDIVEDKDAFNFAIELPGFSREDVTASVKDGVLTVKAVKESKESEGEGDQDVTVLRRERFRCMTASRSFFLGDGVDEEGITAKFEDGVLNLTVPKLEQPLPEERAIQIA